MNEIEYTEEKVQVIRELIAPDLNDVEMKMFLHNCVRTGLDPQLRQIYPLKTYNKKKNRWELVTLVGIDGYRLIADRTGSYSPGRATDFIYDDKGKLIGAIAYVKKLTADGTWHEISGSARMSEYNHTPPWQKMPHVMIEKAAESRALRRAFPANLSGLYTEDEFQTKEEKAPTPELPAPTDNLISEEDFDRMWAVIGDHSDLVNELKSICCTDDLSKINKSKFEACQKYAQVWLKKKKNEKSMASE